MDTQDDASTTKLTKKALITLIDRLWYAIGRRAERGIDTDRRWADLNKLCLRMEKEHVGFGTRLLGHKPPRTTPLQTRARYFAVKAVLMPPMAPRGWAEVGQYREDVVCGAILRHLLDTDVEFIKALDDSDWRFEGSASDLGMFRGIDYAKDLA